MNSKKENDFELNLWTEKIRVLFEQNIDQVIGLYKTNGIYGLESFAAKVGKYIGEHRTVRSYWFSDGALSIDIHSNSTPVKPTDLADYHNFVEHLAFNKIRWDYLESDDNKYGKIAKQEFATYRKRIKFICRQAKKDNRIKHDLENALTYLMQIHRETDNAYATECIDIFRSHYLEGKSINNIIANYPYAIYESELHRRLDYITDELLIYCLKYPDKQEIGLQNYFADHKQEYEECKHNYLSEVTT